MPFRAVRFASVGSTNDIVLDAATAGAAPGLVVVAGEQVRGKGRKARDWASPVGGLWASVLLDPGVPPGLEGLVPLGVGVAAAQALDGLGVPARVRWPNDLMLEDKKLGGILVESRTRDGRFTVLAAGLGLNVANAAPLDHTASCRDVVPGLTPGAVFQALLDELDAVQGELATGDAKRLCERFMRRAWGIDRSLLLDREPVVPKEVAVDGALIVERPGGRIDVVRSGSLRLPPADVP